MNLILLDVFSYSCMNCLRSVEYIKQIDIKYKKYGLETMIIHPPEWGFEKERKNIITILKEYKIKFPLILDKERKIINGFGVNFWPSQILLKDGEVVYKHVGEGNYKDLEDQIIENLKIKNLNSKKLFNKEPKYSKYSTIYCGKRKKGKIAIIEKTKKNKLKFGIIYTTENWIQEDEFLRSTEDNCSLATVTKGKRINFVAQSLTKKPINVSVALNNKFIKTLAITKPQLYNILQLNDDMQQELTLTTEKNLAVYSFSFQ